MKQSKSVWESASLRAWSLGAGSPRTKTDSGLCSEGDSCLYGRVCMRVPSRFERGMAQGVEPEQSSASTGISVWSSNHGLANIGKSLLCRPRWLHLASTKKQAGNLDAFLVRVSVG